MNMTRTSRLPVQVTNTTQRRYPDRLVALAFVLLAIAAMASLKGFDPRGSTYVSPTPARVERAAIVEAPLITFYLVGSEAQRDAVQTGMAELHSNFSVVLVTSPLEEAALASELQAIVEGGQIRAEIIDLR